MTQPPEPIRIANVIARLNIGGTAMHVILLTGAFGPPEWKSTLVCGRVGPDEGDMAYLNTRYSIAPVYIETLGRALHPLRDLRTLLTLTRYFRQTRPHIVHTHTAKAGFVGRLAARLAGVPVILHTFHGHVFRGYFGPRKTRIFLLLERLSARLSSRVFTVSERIKHELANEYHICPAEKITVVPLGLDLESLVKMQRHQGDFRQQWRIPAEKTLVGMIGRMVPIKRHDLFLEAFALAYRQRPDLHAVLVGDGELRPAIEAQIAALGLAEAITLTGWQRDVAPIYSDLDLLVMCSDNEGTPVSVIEALAAGVPVIGTEVGGLPDLLQDGDYGTLVPPGAPDALANGITAAVDTPVAREQRREIVHQYSIETLAAVMTAIYRDLLRAKKIIN